MPRPPALPALTNEEASYLFGLTMGEQLRGLGLADSLQTDAIDRGVAEGLQGKKSSQEDRRRVQEFVRASLLARQERNKQEAEDFLAKNAKEKGVKTTVSGLQYRVLKAGDPKAPAINPTDQVTVNYRGHLIDGTEFDSSYARNAPLVRPLNAMIPGWREGVALMKPGAKFELFVPPELAYGPSSLPGIPGNSLLIFEIELLSVKPAAASNPLPVPAMRPSGAMPPTAAPPASSSSGPAARSATQP